MVRRGVPIGSAVVVVALGVAAALGINQLRTPTLKVPSAARQPAVPARPAPPAATAQKPAPVVPSFDVVKVAPDGTAVIAGRAAPEARVEVLDGDKVVGTVTADQRGEWVLIPDHAMTPGDRVLSLRAIGPHGEPVVRSTETVALSVAPRPSEAALAVALPPSAAQPARVLQQPGGVARGLSLGAVQYGTGGRVTLSGHAVPGATVKIYLGDRLFDSVTADAAGTWSAAPLQPVPGNADTLRLEELAPDRGIAAQVSVPFAPSAEMAAMMPGTNYTVRPGNSLWRIAEHAYGQGLRYVVIYSANRTRIQNPDLIYPGQVLKLPKS